MKRVLFAALAFISLTARPGSAQDFRGEITGRVVDASGGRLPGVTVTATNIATGVGIPTTTNAEGDYAIPFLNPGTYTVTGELTGFKKVARENVEVRVGDKIGLDLTMEVGKMEETVTVTAETPLLETQSGNQGEVIDEKRISMMPLSDGNPFVLARLVPGAAFTGDLKFSRPFDNGGTSSITVNGSTGGNEFTLDGSPDMANGRRVAFVPPAGAVEQFKVETSSFDAASGHTAGATVNVTLKSGTNQFTGSAYEYYRSDKLASTDFFVKLAGQPKPQVKYNRPGFTIGGPVVIPGLYDGHNKTFFFGAAEWLYDTFPEPLAQTVPTDAMRKGDFSSLLPQGIIIYNPASAQLVNGRVVRQPFQGNIISPGSINSIAQKAFSYYPEPNVSADATGQNNFFYANPRNDTFNSESVRVDHTISARQRLFVRYTRNDRREARSAVFGTVNGIIPTGNYLYRKNDGITVDDTFTQSSTALWDIRAGWQRFQEPNIKQHQGIFDPATLGFSPSVLALFGGARYFPSFTFNTISGIGDNLAADTTHSIYSFQPTYTRLMGNHSLRAGYDLRLYHEFGSNLGRQAGEYTNSNSSAFTRQQDNSGPQLWLDVADFLMGYPTGGSIEINGTRLNDTWYNAGFVQDDWKASRKLTLNLGLRYELESATTDSQNRNVRGFDPTAVLQITAAAEAAYAANPDPLGVPPSQFRVIGGLQFATAQNPGFWNTQKNNFQPRAGFAYQLTDKLVVRGGWGIYTVPNIIFGNQQDGYSQTTPIITSQDRGLTFIGTLADPWPTGVLTPAGNSLGPSTFLGQSLDRYVPLDFRSSQNMRYLIDLQRELPAQWVVDVGYTGNYGYDLTTNLDLNSLPAQYLSTSPVRDQPAIDFLSALVPNPLFGLVPTGFTATTVARSQLLRPFPQFNNVPYFGSDGTSTYNSFQLKAEKRFSHGYSVLGSYTYSRYMERISKLNNTDAHYERRLSGNDVPQRVTLSATYELPFGHGRAFGGNVNGLTNGLIGGWSVNAIGTLQSGTPIDFSGRNIYFNGDQHSLTTHYSSNVNVPVFDISGFYFHDAAVQTNGVDDPVKQRADQRIRLSDNVRYFPSRVPGLRTPFLNLWDISIVKQVPLHGTVRAQFNVEILNATNQVVYSLASTDPTNASFGKVNSQSNLPREVQLAAKVVF
jgi:hypothetical protein